MLVDLVCSHIQGATLAHEFARCEEVKCVFFQFFVNRHSMRLQASMLVKSYAVSVLRIADRALGNMVGEVLDIAKQGALASVQIVIAGAFLLHAPAAFFSTFGQKNEARQAEMYSIIARQRMAAALDLETDSWKKKNY